jgi:hypothetical protein
MESHAEDGTLREGFFGDAVPESLSRTLHLEHPNERLAFLVFYESISIFIQRDHVHLEMSRIGDNANHDSRKYPECRPVIHRVRMMRVCGRSQKSDRQDQDEDRDHLPDCACNFPDMHFYSSVTYLFEAQVQFLFGP